MAAKDLPVHENQLSRVTTFAGINIREDTVFTGAQGQEKKGIRRRAENALEKLRQPLGKLLEPSEVVLYVAPALAPATGLEQWTLGGFVYDLKRRMLVLTNRRLLAFRIKRRAFGGDVRWDWRGNLRSIFWGDVEEAQAKGWLSYVLKLKYRGGKKEKYWGLRRKDVKKIRLLLEKLLPASASEATGAREVASLCPNCLAALTPRVYQCQHCGLAFRNERAAILRSIFLPGGGYFYTGERALGMLAAFAEVGLFLALVGLVLELVGATSPGANAPPATWVYVVYVLLVLSFETLVTVYHSLRLVREYLPVKRLVF